MSVSTEGGREADSLTPEDRQVSSAVTTGLSGERGELPTPLFLSSPAGRLERKETARDCRTVEQWGRPELAVGTAGSGRPRESDSYRCRPVGFPYPVPVSGSSPAPAGSRHNPDPALTHLPAPRSAPQGCHRKLIYVTSVPAPPRRWPKDCGNRGDVASTFAIFPPSRDARGGRTAAGGAEPCSWSGALPVHTASRALPAGSRIL